jgi:hypothetical protein
LSLGAASTALAAGTNVARPTQAPAAGIEVIVVTAKRPPPVQPVVAADVVDEVIVTAKRARAPAERVPPAMAIELPKLEISISQPPIIRL